MGFELDGPASEAVLRAMADAMADLGEEVAAEVYAMAPVRTGRYRRTIAATTYLDDRPVSGRALRNIARVPRAGIRTVVYTSSPKGVLVERGTRPHEIPVTLMHGGEASGVIRHPGARARPHFRPAALASVGRVAELAARRLG